MNSRLKRSKLVLNDNETIVDDLPPVDSPVDDLDVAAMKSQLDKQKDELARLKQVVTTAVNQPPPPINGQPMTKEDLTREFYKDPLTITASMTQQALQHYDQIAAQRMQPFFETAKVMARDQARNSSEMNKKVFDKYQAQVEAKVASIPAQFHTNVEVWKNAITMVKGEYAEEIGKEIGSGPLIKVKDGPDSPSHRTPSEPAKEKLSDEERDIARKLRLTDDEYRRGKRRYSDQEAAWDEVLTMDSEQKRKKEANARTAAK